MNRVNFKNTNASESVSKHVVFILKFKNYLRTKIFYKPTYFYSIIDLLILIFSLYVVLDLFPLTTHTPLEKYSWPSLIYIFLWVLFSYFLRRYKPLKKQQFLQITLRLFYVSLVNFVVFSTLIHVFFKLYSGFVLLSIVAGTFIINYMFISLYFAYKYAVEYNEIIINSIDRENAIVKPSIPLDKDSYNQLQSTIRLHSTDKVLRFIEAKIDLTDGHTLVFVTNDVANLQMKPNYQYSSIIQLERLNNVEDINKKLFVINEKLPDNGIFICCFESKSTRKKRFIKNLPKGINYILYFFDFLLKRVLPKLFITSSLYFFITRGKNRIFSKAEVLGRLYCFGFNVVLVKKIGQLTYIISERVKQPEIFQKRNYGTLIRLRRYGKYKETIDVYKIRTMHPYSEYLQNYIYELNRLKHGGKINKDIRITTIGSFMRKYWIDELPMVFNILKGEMKLVGVRPLSMHYFNLYNQELQEKRIKHKPGLMPPFYADLPRSLDEIQKSEMKYLIACETKGVFKTDVRYFIVILKNILINKARSG